MKKKLNLVFYRGITVAYHELIFFEKEDYSQSLHQEMHTTISLVNF